MCDSILRRLETINRRGLSSGDWRPLGGIVKNDVEVLMETAFGANSRDYRILFGCLNPSRVPDDVTSNYYSFRSAFGEPIKEGVSVVKHRLSENQTFVEPGDPTEALIAADTPHTAYVILRDLVEDASTRILLVDPYVDRQLLPLMSNVKSTTQVDILTRAKTLPRDFPLELLKFVEEHGTSVEVRCGEDDFHDRFLLIDGKLFISGASFKDLGKKMSMVVALSTAANQAIAELENRWYVASKI